MTDMDFQGLIAEPFLPDADGFVHLPDKPGLGIELATAGSGRGDGGPAN
jgi:L-alanine-DL-glutamate epimerase-like enolase superfamily enzyme